MTAESFHGHYFFDKKTDKPLKCNKIKENINPNILRFKKNSTTKN